jgi:hypothetical protein
MKCFQNVLEMVHKVFMLGLWRKNYEKFPKLPGKVSKPTWKFLPDQYFQVVFETFHAYKSFCWDSVR